MKTTAHTRTHLRTFLTACTLLATTALAGTASAATLMFDFGTRELDSNQQTNSPLHAADPAFTDTHWNVNLPAYNDSNGSSVLKYSDGTDATGVSAYVGRSASDPASYTSITFQGTPSNFTDGGTAGAGVFAAPKSIGRDGIRAQSTTDQKFVAFALGGLSAGSYDIYIVGVNYDAMSAMKFYATEFTLIDPAQGINKNANNFDASTLISSTQSAVSTNTVIDSWTEGGNYVKLSVTLTGAPNTYLTILALGDGTGNAGRGILNSVQIVSQIPEPATISAIAGLSILFAAFVIRRVRR